jgi:long-chain acyl-CoA synthetase
LKIIDRRKNIFKLSQGEYVAPDKLEQVYKTVRGIADIFVYGDSLKSALVGIANVDPEEWKKICAENNWNLIDLKSYCADVKVNKWYLDALNATTKSSRLKGFERVTKVFLDPVNFGDNQLITTTFKLKRHEAKTHYQKTIDQLYVGLD